MKKLKFLSLSALALSFIPLVACNNANENTNTNETTAPTDNTTTPNTTSNVITTTEDESIDIVVNVYDIDGEKQTFNINCEKGSSLSEELKKVTKVQKNGSFVSSIANSVIDSNYYLEIFENNVSSLVGIDDLVLDDGDVFDFKNTCWNLASLGYGGSLDDTDALVDRMIYHYAKTYLKDTIKKATSYKEVYWDAMFVNLLTEYNYDTNVINFDGASEELINSVKDANVSENSDIDNAKLYFVSKALGISNSSLGEYFMNYYNTLNTYEDYKTPFLLSPAKGLNITNPNIEKVLNESSVSDTQWGTDALNWQISLCASFGIDKFDETITSQINTRTKDGEYTAGGTTNALSLLSFAGLNINPRLEKYKIDNKDVIEYLFDNYYDTKTDLMKCNITDTGTNYSTNQIYASFAVYKCWRDQAVKDKVSIFR